MRKKLIFSAFLGIIAFNFSPHLHANESNDSCPQDYTSAVRKKVDSYQLQIFHNRDNICQRVEISQGSHILFQEEGFDNHYSYFRLRSRNHDDQFVIKRFTGGAHCCTTLLIFDLRHKFNKIAEIDSGNFEPEIIDLDHDHIPEIRFADDFLAYSFSSFGSSAVADVVFKYRNGHYTLAPELMIKPAPSPQGLKLKIARWQKLLRQEKTPDWPPPEVIQDFTDLIYSGYKQIAWSALDQAWPADVEGKTDFINSYQESLAASKYYSEFKKATLNR